MERKPTNAYQVISRTKEQDKEKQRETLNEIIGRLVCRALNEQTKTTEYVYRK